ncbi:phage replisome organizer N-terminal domain-containing protein [Chloroflexota bacterium]
MREETADIRGVWIDLLVLAGSGQYGDTGEIKLSNGVGYTDRQIAQILNIPVALWCRSKKRFLETDRINMTPRGAISITNWSKYQSEYQRQKLYRDRKDESPTPEPKSPFINPLENEKEIEIESEKLQREVTTESYNEVDTKPTGLSLPHLASKGSKSNTVLSGSVLRNETEVGENSEKHTHNLEGKAKAASLTTTKREYGEYQNVLLTVNEHNELIMDYGHSITEDYIRRLSRFIMERGYSPMESHFDAILRQIDIDANRKQQVKIV